MRAGARSLALLLFLFLSGAPRADAQGVPPDANWLAFQTPHFNVSFVEGLEPLARRAANRAEWAYALLSRDFARPPRGRIELLISDHVDYTNGLATPFPRNRIIIYAQPPAGEPTLAHSDDWLQLLTLHELAHIFHLDQAGGIWRDLRTIFGRDPSLFPQRYTPGWIVEGLATYLESSYSEEGRANSALYDMMLRAAVLEGDLFSIDRASLDPVRWPTGNTRYLYGSLFISYLAEKHGAPAVADFIRGIGSQLFPYRLEAAARRAFGVSLSQEWVAWRELLRTNYDTQADAVARSLTAPELLTPEGRFAQHPRFSPDGTAIVYAANTGRDDPGHFIIDSSGSLQTTRRRSSLGPASWIGQTDQLLFAQVDFADRYSLYSDLYIEEGDATRRVTREARVWEPHPHPDGRSAVAVQSAGGANRLVRVDLRTGGVRQLVPPSFDTYWSVPRWSPDGHRIAASIWRPGGRTDVVVLDTLGQIIASPGSGASIDRDPAWSPDGRYVLFTSDRSGIPNLYARELSSDQLWQVTDVLTGAFQPDVSPDGRWLVFSLYQSDGYHVARLPFEPGRWRLVAETAPLPPAPPAPLPVLAPSTAALPYSAFPSILPTYWTLVAEGDGEEDVAFGAALSGKDVIERHSWGAELAVYPLDTRVQGDARYRYAGLGNPVLDLAAGQRWRTEQDGINGEADLLRRTRDGSAALTWLRRRWNATTSLQGGIDISNIDLVRQSSLGETERDFPVDAGAFVGAGYSTVRGFGLSIGPQEGFSTSARVQGRRYLEEPAGTTARGYARVTSRSRAYRGLDWFGFAPPTLAARIDIGVESNAVGPGFSLGGASGESSDLPLEPTFLGRALAYPVRGYPIGVQRGNRVLSGSLEYRFPLALIERGFRLFPLALDRLTGDIFLDGGAAWCEGCSAAAVRIPTAPSALLSAGAETILTLRLGFFNSVVLRLGVAAPFTGGRPAIYLRTGQSF